MGVSLAKGQALSLDKGGLTKVRMGLGWDPAQEGASVDLDASALLFNGTTHLATVWYRNLSANGVTHGGDNLTGAGEGDDETIDVDLDATGADTVAFTVNSFSGQNFNDVKNASCRLLDAGTNEELARYDLSEKNPSTGVVMAVLSKVDSKWEMTAVGHFANGRTVNDMVPVVQQLLSAAA